MSKVIFISAILLGCCFCEAQTVKLDLKYGMGSEIQNQLLDFENVKMETLTFSGAALKGKYYQVFVKEFKQNKLIATDTLFDGNEMDFFKINSDTLRFRLFIKVDAGKLKAQISEPKFSSKKLFFDISDVRLEFAMKNFWGSNPDIQVPVGRKFYAFGIITPTIHKDGSGSYCEVAQSNIDPENIGVKYNIPHYFLIEMLFK